MANILLVSAYAILGFTLYRLGKNGILMGSIIFNVLMTFYFFMVGSVVGGVTCLIAIVRSYYFYRNEVRGKPNPLASLIFFIAIVLISIVVTYDNISSLLMGVLSITGVVIYWYNGSERLDSASLIKFGSPIISLCFILYAIALGSFLMVPLELILLLGGTFGGFKWIKKNGEAGV